MERHPKIFLSLLILLLFGNSLAEAGSSVDNNSAVIYSADKNKARSTHPFDRPNLFNIYHQAESAGSLLNIVPIPYASADERDEIASYQILESEIKKNVSTWLQLYITVDRLAGDLKLIFPFHTFL